MEPTRFNEGMRYEGEERSLLTAAIDAAFDYRGDVTLLLHGGAEITGYLSNRELKAPRPYVEVLSAGAARARRVELADIRGVAFTGKDPASGKSWETWVRKYREKMEARSRGENTGAIGLFPEPLD